MKHPSLNRAITFPMLTLYGLGTILGAGIYVLVGKVAVNAGIYAPIAFLLAALLAALSGYSYAALSSRYPKSAGEVAYVQAAMGWPLLSRLVGWMVALTGVVSAATIANGFVGYFQVFLDISEFWAITGLIGVLTFLAIWGVTASVRAAAIMTILEVIGLLLILVYSAPAMLTIPDRLPELVPPLTDGGIWFGILLGAFLAFYAFIGFEDMVNMAEEVKAPETTLPKAIIAAIVVSSLFYYLIALAAILQMPLDALRASKAPMADIMLQHSTTMAQVISAISLAAIVNGALVQIIMGSRVLYGMGKQNLAPTWLSKVHDTRQTPHIATLMVGIVVWLFALTLDLTALAKLTSFIIITVFLLVNVSLILIAKKETVKPQKAMAVKIGVPYLASVMCIVFLSIQIYGILTGGRIAGH